MEESTEATVELVTDFLAVDRVVGRVASRGRP
jgi:hypothetical protein